MKCSKCKENNVQRANYCKYCGEKIEEKEKQKAYKKTIYGKIDEMDKWYKRITLQNITESLPFQILSILILLGIGIHQLLTMGGDTKILKSKEYEIYRSKEENTYYLLTEEKKEKISINLYIPNRVKKIVLFHYNEKNELIEKTKYKKKNNIELRVTKNDYYQLKSYYNKKTVKNQNIYLYKKENIKIEK